MAKAGAKKAAEQRLPGTEDPEIAEIAAAAGVLIDLESQIEALKPKVKTANADLLAALKKNGKDHYVVGGIEAWIDHGKEKAKAKALESDDDSAEELDSD